MKELIKKTQEAWKSAKSAAQNLCAEQGDLDMAGKLGACQMFTGEESLEDLVSLMFSARGAEFLTTYGFPSVEVFRQYKPFNPERFGVYIDSGEITLTEARRVFLVGNTTATLSYQETAANRVVLMHGARATVIADGFSVVNIETDKSSEFSFIKQGNAEILC